MSQAMDALKTFLAFEEIPWRSVSKLNQVLRRWHPESIIIEAKKAPMVYILGKSSLGGKQKGNRILVFPHK